MHRRAAGCWSPPENSACGMRGLAFPHGHAHTTQQTRDEFQGVSLSPRDRFLSGGFFRAMPLHMRLHLDASFILLRHRPGLRACGEYGRRCCLRELQNPSSHTLKNSMLPLPVICDPFSIQLVEPLAAWKQLRNQPDTWKTTKLKFHLSACTWQSRTLCYTQAEEDIPKPRASCTFVSHLYVRRAQALFAK